MLNPPLIASRLQFRLAGPDDMPILRDLHGQTHRPYLPPGRSAAQLEADKAYNLTCFTRNMQYDMRKPDHHTLLALRDGQPAGFVFYQFKVQKPTGPHMTRRHAVIERFCALPDAADAVAGVAEGTGLLRQFESRMRRRGFLQAIEFNPPFHLLDTFKNAGYGFTVRGTLDMCKTLNRPSFSLPIPAP